MYSCKREVYLLQDVAEFCCGFHYVFQAAGLWNCPGKCCRLIHAVTSMNSCLMLIRSLIASIARKVFNQHVKLIFLDSADINVPNNLNMIMSTGASKREIIAWNTAKENKNRANKSSCGHVGTMFVQFFQCQKFKLVEILMSMLDAGTDLTKSSTKF